MSELSPHFSWLDVVKSNTAHADGIDNSLPLELSNNATSQANLLEVVRAIVSRAKGRDVPALVSSWFRCPLLNGRIGSQPTSAHLLALGTDLTFVGVDTHEAYEIIKTSAVMDLIDQLIIEHDKNGHTWIHIGQNPRGDAPRHQAFELEKKDVKRTSPS
jgi:hypothetical protein